MIATWSSGAGEGEREGCRALAVVVRIRHFWAVVAIVLMPLGGGAFAQCPPQYEVTALIEPPSCGIFGPAGLMPTAMNSNLQVAGLLTCTGEFASFVWSEKMGLNTLSPPPGIGSVQVYDINSVYGTNALGQMTGEMKPSATSNRAFLLSDGEWTNLGTLPEAAVSVGLGLNDDSVVVGYATHPVTGPLQAFKWEKGTMTALSGLTGPDSRANAINALGQITGWMGNGQITDAVAFIWHNGIVAALPPVPGGTTSTGAAINVHGDVAGFGKFFDPVWNANVWRGYAYIEGEAIRIDPLLEYKNCWARSINSSCQIVGNMETVDGRAFLWQNGVLYDLNDLVPPGTTTLRAAWVIDDAGRILATTTFDPPHLLTPLPAPTGDLDCDGLVGVADLLTLLGAWGACTDSLKCAADLDDDTAVGVTDLLILLANWG